MARIMGGPPPIVGTSGDDDLDGTDMADFFEMGQGGHDTIHGLDGSDTVNFGATYDPLDVFVGGKGIDGVNLEGDYSAGATFGSANLTSVERITLYGGFDYTLIMEDGAVAAGKAFLVDGFDLDTGHSFTLDASAETDGAYTVTGSDVGDDVTTGAGKDSIDGRGGADLIDPGTGKDTVNGGIGDDTTQFGTGGLDASDRVDGGDGYDRVELAGDYSGGVTLGRHTLSNVEEIDIDAGHACALDLGNLELPAGSLIVNGAALAAGETFTFNASHVNGTPFLDVVGGQANDLLSGSNVRDRLIGGNGADLLTGNKGDDIFAYPQPTESTGPTYDTIVGFDAHGESIEVWWGGVSGLDPTVNAGKLSDLHFNDQLEAAIGPAELGLSHAVLFQPDRGGLAGALFLIVDGNSQAGYQADQDLVIRLDDARHMGDFSTFNFGT